MKEEKTRITFPHVGIVVVVSRKEEHPLWVEQCMHSIENQEYEEGKVHVRVVENNDNLNTIGRCYNKGWKAMPDKVKWVLYVSDDDWITRDYLRCLVQYAEETSVFMDNVVGTTSYLTLFGFFIPNLEIKSIDFKILTKYYSSLKFV